MHDYILEGFNIGPDTISVTTNLQVSAEKGYLMMFNRYVVGLQNMVNMG